MAKLYRVPLTDEERRKLSELILGKAQEGMFFLRRQVLLWQRGVRSRV
jgi:hypothetical protein